MPVKNIVISLLIFLKILTPTEEEVKSTIVEADKNDEVITLITTGDVMPGRSVNRKMMVKNDFTYPFQKTAGYLREADLTLINLEAPLVENCPETDEGMIFCGDRRFSEGLRYAGIDVVNLANNHIFNHGVKGYCETAQLLEENGILFNHLDNRDLCSDNKDFDFPKIKIKGTIFGFLGYNALEKQELETVKDEIVKAKTEVDFLTVFFHWGAEYQRYPAKETIDLAHRAVESGADLITGNHPHWYQPIEVYKGKTIVYAQGNFVFDQEWSTETKKGYLAKFYIKQNRIIGREIKPVYISDYSQPDFPEGAKGEEIINFINHEAN